AKAGLALARAKRDSRLACGWVGEAIASTYLVTNTGNVTLGGPVTVDDDQTSVTCPAVASLAPGASLTCTASSTIDQADLDAGSLNRKSDAQGKGADPATDTLTRTTKPRPAH